MVTSASVPLFFPILAYVELLFLPPLVAVAIGAAGAVWYDTVFSLPPFSMVFSFFLLFGVHAILSRLLTGRTFVAEHTRAAISYLFFFSGLIIVRAIIGRVYPNEIVDNISWLAFFAGYVCLAVLTEIVRRARRVRQLTVPFFRI